MLTNIDNKITARVIIIAAAIVLIAIFSFLILKARAPKQPPKPVAQTSPTPKPKPLIAFIEDGDLCAIRSDGTDHRIIAAAPEGEAIQDFVWSPDGSRVYFSIGQQFFEIAIATGNAANAGELAAQPGITVDHLEMGRDGKTIIVHAMDADAASRMLAMTIGHNGSRELSIDEYGSLIQNRSPVIHSVGEISVSPDGKKMLFKGVVGTGEELFVADTETGAKIQVTNLYDIAGFEESVETEGGRRVIEAAWSPDSRYVIFNPMQSCSELALCYGRLYLVEAWGGAQLQLSVDMMFNVPVEWSSDGNLLGYDDGSKVVVTDTKGYPIALHDGNHPKWQPGG